MVVTGYLGLIKQKLIAQLGHCTFQWAKHFTPKSQAKTIGADILK